jgi:hypothetical protein
VCSGGFVGSGFPIDLVQCWAARFDFFLRPVASFLQFFCHCAVFHRCLLIFWTRPRPESLQRLDPCPVPLHAFHTLTCIHPALHGTWYSRLKVYSPLHVRFSDPLHNQWRFRKTGPRRVGSIPRPCIFSATSSGFPHLAPFALIKRARNARGDLPQRLFEVVVAFCFLRSFCSALFT